MIYFSYVIYFPSTPNGKMIDWGTTYKILLMKSCNFQMYITSCIGRKWLKEIYYLREPQIKLMQENEKVIIIIDKQSLSLQLYLFILLIKQLQITENIFPFDNLKN